MKTKVFVTGHRNPDMDSIASAISYAYLKQQVDKSKDYVAIRCGSLNPQAKYVLSTLGLTPPMLVKDIYPRVNDVTKRDVVTLDVNDPIVDAISELDQKTLSVIPVMAHATDYAGLVSMHEITDFLISENLKERPIYKFRIDNFTKVLPGYFYRKGEREFSAPVMIGAMPYERGVERTENLDGYKPLLVVGMREEFLKYAIEKQFPAIVLTGMTEDNAIDIDLSEYKGTIFVSQTDTATTVKQLRLSSPLAGILSDDLPRLQTNDNFDRAKDQLVKSSYRGFPVFEGDTFTGVVTRRCFLERPTRELILVDHNEADQSVKGAPDAKITEIIDHHRLGASKTNEPIFILAKPVGCTCTIIYQQYRLHDVEIPPKIAQLMLSAILSDTVLLKSPTATPEDKVAINKLAETAGCNWEEWGKEMFTKAASLHNADPVKVVNGDFKIYEQNEIKIGVSQVETMTLEDFSEVKEKLLTELVKTKDAQKLDWTMLLVTDVLKEESLLLTTIFNGFSDKFLYEYIEDNVYYLPGVLSRKKQLLPEVLRVIEDNS